MRYFCKSMYILEIWRKVTPIFCVFFLLGKIKTNVLTSGSIKWKHWLKIDLKWVTAKFFNVVINAEIYHKFN